MQTMKTEDWKLTQPPQDHLKAEWSGGRFETARRGRTGEVEGKIEPHFHLIMVTLNGGAAYHAFRTDDGYRYEGRDAKGMFPFCLPVVGASSFSATSPGNGEQSPSIQPFRARGWRTSSLSWSAATTSSMA